MWKSELIDKNLSWKWHYNYSFRSTEFLGYLACRVTSKITEIGSAERNWGDVKHIKSGKRIAMNSRTLNMQTTIYGSACIEKNMKRADYNKKFTLWDDNDLEYIGPDRYCNEVEDIENQVGEKGGDIQNESSGSESSSDSESSSEESEKSAKKTKKTKRRFYCHLESWEHAATSTDSMKNYDLLMKKYGGIWFHDGKTKYTINGMVWYKKDKKYMLRGITDEYNQEKDDADPVNKNKYRMFEIDNDTLGIIWDSHFDRRNKGGNGPNMEYEDFKVDGNKVDLDENGKWANFIPSDDEEEGTKKRKATKSPAGKEKKKKGK